MRSTHLPSLRLHAVLVLCTSAARVATPSPTACPVWSPTGYPVYICVFISRMYMYRYKRLSLIEVQRKGYKLNGEQLEEEMELQLTNMRGSRKKDLKSYVRLHDEEVKHFLESQSDDKKLTPRKLNEGRASATPARRNSRRSRSRSPPRERRSRSRSRSRGRRRSRSRSRDRSTRSKSPIRAPSVTPLASARAAKLWTNDTDFLALGESKMKYVS